MWRRLNLEDIDRDLRIW